MQPGEPSPAPGMKLERKQRPKQATQEIEAIRARVTTKSESQAGKCKVREDNRTRQNKRNGLVPIASLKPKDGERTNRAKRPRKKNNKRRSMNRDEERTKPEMEQPPGILAPSDV